MDLNDNNNNNNFLERINPKSTILDLLRHEVNITIGTDRTLRRLEKTILNPQILKNLSFEQIMILMDKLMRRGEKGKEFLIDFYRVTSKNPEIQSALRPCISTDQEIGEELSSVENEKEFKQKLIGKLDQVLALERRENGEE